MYLSELMQGEKYAFYSIVKHMVSADGTFSVEELELMQGFLDEMAISENLITEIPLNDAIQMFSYSSEAIRRKVFIELVGVTLCDSFLHENEKILLSSIADSFLISEEEQDEIFEMVQEILKLYSKLQEIIDRV